VCACNIWTDEKCTTLRPDASGFALRNAVHHLLGAGRVDEARRALLNFDFLLQALEENNGRVPSSRLVVDAEPFLDKLGTDAY
jgi:hypothetical protein